MSLLANSNAMTAQGGGYTISNSLRFQSASSQYLTKTFISQPNTWTASMWVKRGSLGSGQTLMAARWVSGVANGIYFNSNDTIAINLNNAAALTTTAVYRDPSAWYHIVVSVTQSGLSYLYVNGAQVGSWTSGVNSWIFTNAANYVNAIGRNGDQTANYFDGYMAEVNFIDGQALTPSSFGISDPYTGQWEAKKYTGTYGTNGFYLPFSDGTSTVTLGVDYSGNNNNWALNAFTRSAGVSDCWMKDVPSGNGFGGVNASSNYAVMNRLKIYTANFAITNANLTASDSSTGNVTGVSTLSTGTSGKYYFECTMTAVASSSAGSGSNVVGVAPESSVNANSPFLAVGSYRSGNPIYNLAGVAQTAGATYTTGDVIGVAVDVTNGTVQFYKNNVAQGATPSFTFTAGTELWPFVAGDNVAGTKTYNLNFGQRSFAYTPPTGFLPLCTANLSSPTIWQGNKYMDATLYTGNGTSLTVTNAAGFRPDFVWGKSRSLANSHILANSVAGANQFLISNSTAAEATNAQAYASFNSNGFTLGNDTSLNSNGSTNVAWQWQAGQGTTSSNTQGSITSTVSVNTTAGFSIVTFTSTGSAGAVTVGHGLGVAPAMVITKERGAVGSWGVYHKGLATPASQYLNLQTTSAATTNTSYWGNTNPSSTVVTLGNGTMMALNTTMVMYCFAEIAGFSKFGSYTGNGSADGPFIYCGFRPKYVMIKNTSSTGDWMILDTARDTYNVAGNRLFADSSSAESAFSCVDIVSNGFKIKATGGDFNSTTSGWTYIYMAFAESPFNFSNAR